MAINGKILEEIGFTKAEALVYLKLLKIGKTKSGAIIKQTSLQSSVVHNALNTLIDKGFVSYILEGKVKRYVALSPTLIEKYIESKKQEFRQILPELKALSSSSSQLIPNVEVYEGYNGLKTATLKLMEFGRKGDIYKYFTADPRLLGKEALEFFSKMDILKKSKGIMVKGISTLEHKIKLKPYRHSQVKYTRLKIPPAMNVFKDMVLIFDLGEKPIAVLIESPQIAKQYHQLWNDVWKSAKK